MTERELEAATLAISQVVAYEFKARRAAHAALEAVERVRNAEHMGGFKRFVVALLATVVAHVINKHNHKGR
jgi:hypothetical protein